MSDGISVEVLGNFKERYPAKIQSFHSDKEINLKFDEFPDVVCKLPTELVHLNVEQTNKSEVNVGSDVLVYQKCEFTNNETNFDNVKLNFAWWPAKVVKLKGSFAAVSYSHKENENNSDIVELSALRPLPQSSPILKKDVHIHEMIVPDELCDFCENYDHRADLSRWCGPSIVVNFDREFKRLQIFSTQKEVVRRASLLDASFMRVLRQKKLIHVQKAELSKKLHDAAKHNFIEEFTVSDELMGLAIGSQGSNIKKARELEGIINIDLDDRTRTFTITAQNEESAKTARAQLEYIKDIYYVPEDVVSKVIGKNGNQIQDIIDQSGVMRVRVAQQPHISNWVDEENKHLLEDHVPFIFVGNRNSIRDARLLLEFSIDHHREMDRLQKERDEMHREIRINNKASGSSFSKDSRHNSTSEREDDQYGSQYNQFHRPYGGGGHMRGNSGGNNRNQGRGGNRGFTGGYKGQPGSHSDADISVAAGDDQFHPPHHAGGRNRGGPRQGSYRRPPVMNNQYRQGSLPPGINGAGGPQPTNGGNRRYYEESGGNTTDDYSMHDGLSNKNGPKPGGNNQRYRNNRGGRGGNRSQNNRQTGNIQKTMPTNSDGPNNGDVVNGNNGPVSNSPIKQEVNDESPVKSRSPQFKPIDNKTPTNDHILQQAPTNNA